MKSQYVQALWMFCLLIVLACSGWYFASNTESAKLSDAILQTTADTIVTNLLVRQYDIQGKPANLLYTPEMQHIPDQDVHLLKMPQITVHQADQSVVHISSQTARAVHGDSRITFDHQVIIHQKNIKDQSESSMQTEQLIYFPKKQFASSNRAVTFIQPGTVIHSQGIKAWLADKHVVLLNKASATYEPNHA